MEEIDLERAMREQARWRILRALDAGRPQPVADALLFRVMGDIALPMTIREVRREMAYLEERGLVEILGKEGPAWLATLTRTGIDLVEYTIPCDPGIARPPRY